MQRAVAWLLQDNCTVKSISVMSMAFPDHTGGREGRMHVIAWVQLVTVHGGGDALHAHPPLIV